MKNSILSLVLISGLLAGYLIGDFRGKDVRESLQKTIATGKLAAADREATIAQLKTELNGINEKHLRELATIRKDYEAKTAAWRHNKARLKDNIKRSTRKLAESTNKLKSLVAQADSASETEKARLEMEIARLRKQQAELRDEIEGNACLQVQVPQSVFESLNQTSAAGSKK
jgi:uncharacterized protein YdcH (DUF465 family)